jgi:MHS family alpha-ketoglutarate permease-like MFS transporter
MKRKEAGSISGLLHHKRAVLLVLAFTTGGSLYFYTFTTYMQKFLVVSAGMSPEVVSVVMTASLICFMLCQPIFGLVADKLGIKTHMLLFSGLAALLVVPILFTLKSVTSPYAAFGLVVSGLLIASFYTPIAGLVKADLFPATVRALGVGLPYALANALFGGTAEYAALAMRAAHVESYFFYYVAALSAITFLASALMPDLAKYGYLDGTGEVEANTGIRRA